MTDLVHGTWNCEKRTVWWNLLSIGELGTENSFHALIVSLNVAPFTLFRFHMKTERNLSVLALHSHCSAVKTELFKNGDENA